MTRNLARGLAVAMATVPAALVAAASAHAGTTEATTSGQKVSLTGSIGIQTQRYDVRLRIAEDANVALEGNALRIDGPLPGWLSRPGGTPIQATAKVSLFVLFSEWTSSSVSIVRGSLDAVLVAPDAWDGTLLARGALPAGRLTVTKDPQPGIVGWLTRPSDVPVVAIQLSGKGLPPERTTRARRADRTPPLVRDLRTSAADIDLGEPDDPFILTFAVNEPGHVVVTVSKDGDRDLQVRTIRRPGRIRVNLNPLLRGLDDLDPGRVTVRVVAVDRAGNRSRPRTIRIPVTS
jgi:hypothetical protein